VQSEFCILFRRQDAGRRTEEKKWNRGCSQSSKKTKIEMGGHVARMDQERWAYATTVWDPRIGRRNRERPQCRWDQEFREVVGNQWSRIARDRGKWKDALRGIN
jgi:hypothetical protein